MRVIAAHTDVLECRAAKGNQLNGYYAGRPDASASSFTIAALEEMEACHAKIHAYECYGLAKSSRTSPKHDRKKKNMGRRESTRDAGRRCNDAAAVAPRGSRG